MSAAYDRQGPEVDDLLRNAQLRDELEPYMDESILSLDTSTLSLAEENEYLESMLRWERAPALPISQWFEPELTLPHPSLLDDAQLHDLLWDVIQRLYDKRILLLHTDHLSDRQLYQVIYRDILPACEKKLDSEKQCVRWDCVDPVTDADTWLAYYASDDDRAHWADSNEDEPPPRQLPAFPRTLPDRGA